MLYLPMSLTISTCITREVGSTLICVALCIFVQNCWLSFFAHLGCNSALQTTDMYLCLYLFLKPPLLFLLKTASCHFLYIYPPWFEPGPLFVLCCRFPLLKIASYLDLYFTHLGFSQALQANTDQTHVYFCT